MSKRKPLKPGLPDLVGLVYAAASNPEEWLAFLKEFGSAVGSNVAALHGDDLSCNRGSVDYAVNRQSAGRRVPQLDPE